MASTIWTMRAKTVMMTMAHSTTAIAIRMASETFWRSLSKTVFRISRIWFAMKNFLLVKFIIRGLGEKSRRNGLDLGGD